MQNISGAIPEPISPASSATGHIGSDAASFAGFVAHELRQPLSVIQSLAYYLRNTLTSSQPAVQESLQLLDQQVGLAENILASLVDYARLGALSKSKVDLRHLVSEVLNRFTPAEGITIERHLELEPFFAVADAIHVDRIVFNLVANALESIAGRGVVAVSLHREPHRCLLVVADTGGGVEPENVSGLFQKGFTTKASGMGLGLILSQELAEANGGTISWRSNPGKGTIFELRLPIT